MTTPTPGGQLLGLLWAEYDVVAIVRDGRELVEAVQWLEPDVIMADITMPP